MISPWTAIEQKRLQPIVDLVVRDIESIAARRILVLCSASGEVAEQIASRIHPEEVVGLEYDDSSLQDAIRSFSDDHRLRFEKALMDRIPFSDDAFDAVVSEFIVFPTPKATDIGQPEMARVLRPGGVLSTTDVVVPVEPPPRIRRELTAAGLDYLCVATPDDFARWMEEAGLTEVLVEDVTRLVRPVWEARADDHPAVGRHLLGSGPWALGRGLRYLRVRGTKAN